MYRMTDPDLYRMTDLINLTGLSRWAIVKYRRLRILPPPVGPRSDARYTPLHLKILRDLKAHKDRNLTLNDITVDVQSRYADAFPDHERHPDLAT